MSFIFSMEFICLSKSSKFYINYFHKSFYFVQPHLYRATFMGCSLGPQYCISKYCSIHSLFQARPWPWVLKQHGFMVQRRHVCQPERGFLMKDVSLLLTYKMVAFLFVWSPNTYDFFFFCNLYFFYEENKAVKNRAVTSGLCRDACLVCQVYSYWFSSFNSDSMLTAK